MNRRAAATATAPDAARPLGTWRNRILGSGEEAPDQLVANPKNWRTHPAAQRNALRGALDTVGWVQQVIVNQRTGNVVDGHARIEEAISRNEPVVPVLYVDLSEEEEVLVLTTLDPIGAMATTDEARLNELIAEVSVDDAGLERLLQNLGSRKPLNADPDAVPDVPQATDVRPDDLFALGGHRLLCGDSTDPAAVARLLGGSAPRLLNTDPPYGVQLDPTWRDGMYNARVAVSARLRADAVAEATRPESDGSDALLQARIKRERERAALQFAKDRDLSRLEATMARLDAEAEAAVAHPSRVPTAAEARAYLESLPELWAKTTDAGRHAIAEAVFERIDVLGANDFTFTLTARAKAHGWDAAFGLGDQSISIGQSGRGESV